MEYILSILIPTKNRKRYLLSCVDEVLANCSENVEVVIQDNSDEPVNALELPQAKNLFYYHESTPLSFVDNFSKALENAHGQYVCFIGDDDGVTKYLELVAIEMAKNDIVAVSQDISVTYFWPKALDNSSQNGLLKFYYVDEFVRKVNTKKELIRLLKDGCQGYLERFLVKPYHGVVKRDVFDEVKRITGQYINGLSPDIYVSVALSILTDEVFITRFPLTISGTCPKSGGAASANGSHTGKLKDAPHFRGHVNYEWDPNVPTFYSVETIWADSALHAFNDILPEMVDLHFEKEYLLRICKKKYKDYKTEIQEYEKNTSISMGRVFFSWIRNDICNSIRRLCRRIVRKPMDYIKTDGVQDIFEANQLTNAFIQNKGVDFANLVSGIKAEKAKGI